METLNCMKCKYRHEDNGNCTAVGGFCTAVPAAYCQLLRDFLDTGLMPDEIRNMSGEWCAAMSVLNGMGSYDRLRELAKADKDGRVIILPCKVYETDGVRVYEHTVREVIYETAGGPAFDKNAIGKSIFLTRAEAEKALQQMEGENGIENSKSYPEKDELDGTLRQ